MFRYATNSANTTLARSWTTDNGDNAYFSVDGTNLWGQFNTVPGGDLCDFWGLAQDPVTYLPLYFSLPGVTPHAEVQDAYGTPGFFSYPTNDTGYVLQENIGLAPGSWVGSATGYANPAVITATSAQKFYRLHYQPVAPAIAPAKSAAVQASTNTKIAWATHVLLPRPN